MCGLCGIVYDDPSRPVDKGTVVQMRDRMIHRGPDDAGVYIHRNIGLGHRRLSIIDLAGGHQPMSNEDQTMWIVFNGEIYNYRALHDFLIKKGHKFQTSSDTEVIVHLYEQFGPTCVEQLNGMFTFAIWDQKTKQLFIARDRMGIKPLYYWKGDGSFVFASEIKALLAYDPIEPSLNSEVLLEYLVFRYPHGHRTFFRGIQSLEPGHTLLWKQGALKVNKYWSINFRQEDDRHLREDVEELDALMADSVRMRLMSEVPLGTYCSGGVDSSLITAYAAKQNGGSLNTFSVGFEEQEFDESLYAKKVAALCGTTHHQLVVNEQTYVDVLPRAIWLLESPLNHAHSVQLYLLSQLAKETVTVMLTGEGSDELFGGYPRYRLLTARLLSEKLPKAVLNSLAHCLAPFRTPRVMKLRRALSQPLARVIAENAVFVSERAARELCLHDGDHLWNHRFQILQEAEANGADPLAQLLYLDLKTYLVSLLDRQDKMSMGASIESRLPYLDFRVVQRSLQLSASKKINGMENKHIIKQLARRYLPDDIVYRKKSGFGVPLAQWLRNTNGLGKYLEFLRTEECRQRGLWNTHIVERMIKEHVAGTSDHSELLWELVNLEVWCKLYLDQKGLSQAV